VTHAERLEVLRILGSTDPEAGLADLNAKGIEIVDAVARSLRADRLRLRRAGLLASAGRPDE
jgi:hypothetical protein